MAYQEIAVLATGTDVKPKGWYRRDGSLRGSEQPVPGKCGRKLKGTDPPRYCMWKPARGRDCCKYHGANTPAGCASPNWKHGDRRRKIPGPIGAAYEHSLRNPNLQGMNKDIAALDAICETLWERLGTGETDGAWDALQDIAFDARTAQTDGTLDVPALLDRIEKLARGALNSTTARREYDQAAHSRAKLIDAEKRRQLADQELTTKVEVVDFMRQCSSGIRALLSDPLPVAEVLGQMIAGEIERIIRTHPATARAVTDAVQE